MRSISGTPRGQTDPSRDPVVLSTSRPGHVHDNERSCFSGRKRPSWTRSRVVHVTVHETLSTRSVHEDSPPDEGGPKGPIHPPTGGHETLLGCSAPRAIPSRVCRARATARPESSPHDSICPDRHTPIDARERSIATSEEGGTPSYHRHIPSPISALTSHRDLGGSTGLGQPSSPATRHRALMDRRLSSPFRTVTAWMSGPTTIPIMPIRGGPSRASSSVDAERARGMARSDSSHRHRSPPRRTSRVLLRRRGGSSLCVLYTYRGSTDDER